MEGKSMVLRASPVPMPEKRVNFRPHANGTIYVYYVLRAYRNKNGKPANDEAAIGKKDPATGNLVLFEIMLLLTRSFTVPAYLSS
jgi:hypothetical protein